MTKVLKSSELPGVLATALKRLRSNHGDYFVRHVNVGLLREDPVLLIGNGALLLYNPVAREHILHVEDDDRDGWSTIVFSDPELLEASFDSFGFRFDVMTPTLFEVRTSEIASKLQLPPEITDRLFKLADKRELSKPYWLFRSIASKREAERFFIKHPDVQAKIANQKVDVVDAGTSEVSK